MKRKISVLFGVLTIAIGIGIYLYPTFREYQISMRAKEIILDFEKRFHIKNEEGQEETETLAEEETFLETEPNPFLEELLAEMLEYNKGLVENGQKLVDAWSYTQSPVNLRALEEDDGAMGYIEIPDMDVVLPLYIGASPENMAKGAAVLAETSMPVGGPDTNCVISGHRGYGGAPYFREIEKLQKGSRVCITNPWGRLTYKVSSISIISPHDVESILIQPGKDMVTLLTCHPYMSHGRQRYVVYCERDTGLDNIPEVETLAAKPGNTEEKDNPGVYQVVSEQRVDDSSELLILREKMVRVTMPFVVLVLILIMVFTRKKGE